MTKPAENLVGCRLSGGWKVVEKLPKLAGGAGGTGGRFSDRYIVESEAGEKAFLKALDYSSALKDEDPATALQEMTAGFIYERNLLDKCRDHRLDRVVTAISYGTVTSTGEAGSVVQYLIFELADGDVRHHITTKQPFDLAWKFRCLHHIATGLEQLHGQDIAHQDVKPSNVLVFEAVTSKLGDLGRASSKATIPPHETKRIAGDWAYAPPELLYGQVSPEWNQRRFGCDAYLLGSMVHFLFTSVSMTSAILLELPTNYHWSNWKGFYGDVLPYVRDAFGRVLQSFRKNATIEFQDDIVQILEQLCDPDPERRGHPINKLRPGNPYSLERYVSWLNLLASRAEAGLKQERNE